LWWMFSSAVLFNHQPMIVKAGFPVLIVLDCMWTQNGQ
jgi:hypothetical protein